MTVIITFLAAVFVFSAVIAIHEFGHFAVAKLCGIQVNEFSIGMGPSTACAPCPWAALWRWKGRKAPKAGRRSRERMRTAPRIREP